MPRRYGARSTSPSMMHLHQESSRVDDGTDRPSSHGHREGLHHHDEAGGESEGVFSRAESSDSQMPPLPKNMDDLALYVSREAIESRRGVFQVAEKDVAAHDHADGAEMGSDMRLQ
eukprot:1055045-Rhodomonas_salina.6